MSFIRFVVFGLLFYFVFKLIKYFFAILLSTGKKREEVKVNTSKSDISSKINKDDIVEAEFEEIKNNDS